MYNKYVTIIINYGKDATYKISQSYSKDANSIEIILTANIIFLKKIIIVRK